MKRNYESISHYSAQDKGEFAKLKQAKEEAESKAKILASENIVLKKETSEY